MLLPSELYITDYTQFISDLYRSGNAQHPRFDHARPGHDAHIYETNGVKWIRADGNGISAFTTYDKTQKNWWKIPAGTDIPSKIKLVRDLRPGFEHHFMVAPEHDMLLSEYAMLLDQVRIHCQKVT